MVEGSTSKKVHNGHEDILRSLPELILNHILSFLPTVDVVRTCVLSSEWKYIWTSVNNLQFEDCLPHSRSWKHKTKENFMQFVEKVLLHGCPVIDKFYLKTLEKYDVSRVHMWISTAIRRNVRKLIISTRCTKRLTFPRCLYDNENLVEMDVQMFCTIKVPTSVCFLRLKILRLSGVTLSSECSQSSELHFSFPVLESLSFGCLWKKVNVVNIDTPKLISFDFFCKKKMNNFAVKLNASSLEKFECRGSSFVDFTLSSNVSVIHATIEIYDIKEQEVQTGLLICRLIRQFANSEHLSLSSQTVAALTYLKDLQDHLPAVDKVNHLTIQGIWWKPHLIGGFFFALLQCLPNLECLVFVEGIAWFQNEEMVEEVVPWCFQTQLKVVRFECFDDANGIELAKLVLKNALVLKEMTVTAGRRFIYPLGSEFEEIKEQLLASPRGSPHASISFGRLWSEIGISICSDG